MKIYNTLTRKKEEFVPIDENEIKITAVYNPIDHKGYFMD